MKIQRLFLRNVRNIKELDLDFRDPVTGKPMSRIVLAGANGSGKTTILESLFGFLSATEYLGGISVDEKTGRWLSTEINVSGNFQAQIAFEVELLDQLSTVSFGYGFASEHEPLFDTPGATVSFYGNGWSTGSSPLIENLAKKTHQSEHKEKSVSDSVIYFPNNRYLPTFEKGELSLESRLYQWAYRYQASSQWKGSIESYLFSLNYLDLEDRDKGMPADRFQHAVGLVNSVLEGKRIAKIERGRAVVETSEGHTHSLADLSSGEKQIVLLLIEILRRIVPGSIILIDEPEISLHQAWQRGLMAALEKLIEQYDAQIILATHSEEIATSVMPHEVMSLSDLDNLPRGEWKPEVELLP